MGNPIMDILGQQQKPFNPMSLLQNSEKMQQLQTVIRQNGGDAKTAFYNLAQQKGVNPDDILAKVRQMMR